MRLFNCISKHLRSFQEKMSKEDLECEANNKAINELTFSLALELVLTALRPAAALSQHRLLPFIMR